MNFKEMFESQEVLDAVIINNMEIRKTEAELYRSNILSIIVELSEVANANRSFKYWSKNGSMPREIILDELADVLHFLLSLGNKLNHDIVKNHKFSIMCYSIDLIEEFIMLVDKACKMKQHGGLDIYFDLFNNFLGLVVLLGFDMKELEAGYYKKHEVNYQRQENGY